MRLHNDNAPGSPAFHGQGSEGADKEDRSMSGNQNSGRKPGPRALRDEVMFDLDAQLDELHALVADVSTIARMVSHVQRRAAALNRLRSQSIANMREAQNLDDRDAMQWDGIERRREALTAVAA